MISLYDKLLEGSLPVEGTYKIIDIPNYPNHKIGIDYNTSLNILLYTSGDRPKVFPSRRFKYFELLFNRKCRIANEKDFSNDKIIEEYYTILTLKPINRDLQIYFLSLCNNILEKVGNIPSASIVAIEINKILSLFQHLSNPPINTIQGLFGELLIINKSNSPEYLVKAWHIKENALYDFDDGIECLEVKTSSNSKRIHTFSQTQLNPKIKKDIHVASILVQQSDFGYSIFYLADLIREKISDANLLHKLNEMIFKSIGNEVENLSDIKFDYDYSIESIQFFNIKDIPKIQSSHVPKGISALKYNVSLEESHPSNITTTLIHP